MNSAFNSIEWTPEDIAAEREGAALLRLSRRTGASFCDAPPVIGPDRQRIYYRRGDAVAAFERLFSGERTSQAPLVTRADESRRKVRGERLAADVAAAAALRGLSRDQQRAALASLRAAV